MERKLKALIKDIPSIQVKGSKEVEIKGLSNDSRKVEPKDLFFAKKGKIHDGNDFIEAALQSGASAVVTDIYNPFLSKVTQIISSDIDALEAIIAARFFHNPSKKLQLIGVTGTNGKTTTTYLIRGLLQDFSPCGLIGTVEYAFFQYHFPATFTTPDIITNQRLLDQMSKSGCKSAVMEVSSHGLDQRRVEGLYFDQALLTNFSEEHLDYHKDMESYAAAKLLLFSSLSKKAKAIVNRDSSLAGKIKTQAKLFTYSLQQKADYQAVDIRYGSKKTQFAVLYQGEKISITSPLVGEFNVYNLLAAIASCHISGMSFEQIQLKAPFLQAAPGRLQKIEHKKPFSIFVDFAHTEDALRNLLRTLHAVKKGRIITVFGCGGNRDPFKRPKMGQVAEEFSDIIIVTNDNPRMEDPQEIAAQIEKGFSVKASFERLLSRKEAIQKALLSAKENDIVVIAGKGHEKTQIIGSQSFPFDDVKVTKEILDQRG